MLVTAQTLENLKACEDQIETLSQIFPNGCETNRVGNLCLAEEKGLNISWAISKRLVPKQTCLENPQWAYSYALGVDQQPRDDTRLAACKDPHWAYLYALYVDRQPRDDTRLIACKDPKWAYCYARDVDRQPREDTRLAVCENPEWAYYYTLKIDKQLNTP